MTARVLVVDDIEANRRLLQAKLEAQYYTVMLAENGIEALSMVERSEPDIILLDVMMPGMDGYEVCRRLKENPATNHIPVVMVTALNDVEDRVRGLEVGAEDFLTKPVDDFALMARMGALIRYNAVASELRQRQASGLRAGIDGDDGVHVKDQPARLFVVDDNPRTSTRIADTLRAGGHTAITLLEAGGMKGLNELGVDILVLSMLSDRYDALKLCAHFKMNEATRSISILLICDPDDRQRAGKGLDLGASDVIFAPIEKQELLARVRTQARRTRYIEMLRDRVDRGLELSVIDQLTGLYNRRYMNNQLEQLMQRSLMGGRPVSVLMADIDHFKAVNDTYGHDAGDEVLQEMAKRLKTNSRVMDVVCRPGGEEFMVIMPDTPGDLACAAAERIRRSVAAEPFVVSGGAREISITLSAGVSTIRGASDTIADLIKRADTALYQAKAAGRNRVESIAA
ncbi:PleD family two-component system response regulator [uncultured Hyphomonas sp.]|uniref:PleD family two-component system response regulator n=1 Tax=uncultured Hyphomonas sp. TaxID=225298 RepID=UPI000C4A879F|nr:PleD family two-component system response regulator [Hyphomonadaceae bacterium]MBA29916.1 PleD family two-component system response regulator [Hyphomonadaceae bacterium]MBL4879292.1 PleD family two-component system response regulator [Hyphomonas sp.]